MRERPQLFLFLSIFWSLYQCGIVLGEDKEPKVSTQAVQRLNDVLLVNCSVFLNRDQKYIDETFILWHSDLWQWREKLSNFSTVYKLSDRDQSELHEQIYQYLQATEKFSTDRLLRNHFSQDSASTLSILERLLLSHHSYQIVNTSIDQSALLSTQNQHFFYTIRERHQYQKILSSFPRIIDYYQFIREQSTSYESIVPSFLQSPEDSRIIVYQTRNAFTGGTTAMRILALTLEKLGYPVILCNDTNYDTSPCRKPRGQDIAITGEWCREVLEEYVNTTDPEDRFVGRGIQYYLGFHHARHYCRGWIATADSHYLSHQLGNRLLHSLFLGCPMSETIQEKVHQIISCLSARSFDPSVSCHGFVDIEKENLILLDYDFFQDYPTQPFIFQLELPVHTANQSSIFQVLLLKGDIPSDRMSYYLQRAKYVIDLALPGPERISSEAILFGAIPIISHRWNGISDIDFPVKFKLDLFQFPSDFSSVLMEGSETNQNTSHLVRYSELSTLLSRILPRYESEITTDPHQHIFYEYILSMSYRLVQTADRFFGSQYYQLEIVATTLEEELIAIFQILAWIYDYPLISIQLYVVDKLWFMKHYYLFIDVMIQSGYLRYDPHDPRDTVYYEMVERGEEIVSYLQIDSIFDRKNVRQQHLQWKRIMVEIPIGVVIPDHPTFLFQLTKTLNLTYTVDQLRQTRFQTIVTEETKDKPAGGVSISYYYADSHYPPALERSVVDRNLASKISNNRSTPTLPLPGYTTICDLLQSHNCSSRICDVQQLPAWLMMKQSFLRQLDGIFGTCSARVHQQDRQL